MQASYQHLPSPGTDYPTENTHARQLGRNSCRAARFRVELHTEGLFSSRLLFGYTQPPDKNIIQRAHTTWTPQLTHDKTVFEGVGQPLSHPSIMERHRPSRYRYRCCRRSPLLKPPHHHRTAANGNIPPHFAVLLYHGHFHSTTLGRQQNT